MDFPNNITPKLNEIPIEQLRALDIQLSNDKVSPCGHKVKVVNDRELKYLTNGCSICLESFKNKTICKYNCGHIFDEDCSRKWLLEHPKCPTCRDGTKDIQNYKNPTEYFHYECIECDDEQCCKDKLQTQPNKIPINNLNGLNTDTGRTQEDIQSELAQLSQTLASYNIGSSLMYRLLSEMHNSSFI